MLERDDIKKLFLVMQARYGHKWTSAYDDDNVIAVAILEWHRAFQFANAKDIRRGLDRWKESWPPSLPEFIRACTPSADEQFDELCRRELEMESKVRALSKQPTLRIKDERKH